MDAVIDPAGGHDHGADALTDRAAGKGWLCIVSLLNGGIPAAHRDQNEPCQRRANCQSVIQHAGGSGPCGGAILALPRSVIRPPLGRLPVPLVRSAPALTVARQTTRRRAVRMTPIAAAADVEQPLAAPVAAQAI